MRAWILVASRAVRLDDWWGYKMGPVLALALTEVLLDGVAPGKGAVLVGLVALSGASLAAYGHVLNDVADVAADAAAGKPNVAAMWSPLTRAGVVVGLLAATFGVWAAHPISPLALGLLALDAALLAVYALPPARLKERGVLGVAADAAYAHVVPCLFVLAVFDEGGTWRTAWALAIGMWAAAYGVRGILLHQLWDAENDRRAGLATLATQAGPARVRRWGRVAYAIEVVAAAAVVAGLGRWQPAVAAALAVVTVLAVGVKRWGRGTGFDPMPPHAGLHVPLVLAYAVWPGLLVGAALVARDLRFLPLLAGYGLLLAGPIDVVVGGLVRGTLRKISRAVWRK